MESRSSSSSFSPEIATVDSTPNLSSPDSATSWSDGPLDYQTTDELAHKHVGTASRLPELFDENIAAKAIRVGIDGLDKTEYSDFVSRSPRGFPETVPQQGANAGSYHLREPEFWTCGFFPGTLYALLERSIKFPQAISSSPGRDVNTLRRQLQSMCEDWASPIHAMSGRTDTHDIGFIVMPALRRDWELRGNKSSLDSIIRAARSLSTRFSPGAGAIRSWDLLLKKEIQVTDMEENLLVIIDSLCNLDLLFYAASQTGDGSLARMAATHARTLQDTHLRPESADDFPGRVYRGQLYSTCHVANISPQTGSLKWRWTAQGYSNDSTWARGQSWAILGYAQTYMWTKDLSFLEAACGTAEYFIYRLETSPTCVEIPMTDAGGTREARRTKGRYVPLWDWDAPVNPENPLRDSSAGIIAANGMLILSQALRGVDRNSLAQHFHNIAIKIVRDTIDLSLAPETMRLSGEGAQITGVDAVPGQRFDGILKNGTANNNENARRRYADHGLVYGDYYFIEFGNRLLNMGLA